MTDASGLPAQYHDHVPSTNDLAWSEGRAAFRDRGLSFLGIVANRQTDGRGRAGRAWHSPGGGLYLSCYFRLGWAPERAAMLTLAAGLAARAAIKLATGVAPHLKWPNDLLAPDGSGRKLGGILTETRSDGPRIADAVIGLGVNLRTPEQGYEGDFPASPVALDAFAEPGRVPTPAALAPAVMRALHDEVRRLGQGEAEGVVRRARDAMAMWGRRVHAQVGPRAIDGVARDLAADGGLVVRLDSGAEVIVHAGDVRVRWDGAGSDA